MVRLLGLAFVCGLAVQVPVAAKRFHGMHAHPGGGFHRAPFAEPHCRWRRIDGERRRLCW